MFINAAVGAVILAVTYYYMQIKNPQLSPIAEVLHGKLQGVVGSSRDGRLFHSYFGIPFARPPIGNLRFESPDENIEPWQGIRNAEKPGSMCLQLSLMSEKVEGSEDCLYLNVHAPKVMIINHPLDVYVWVHGGLFHNGNGDSFSPEYFMDEDVILVTVNYRLGPLGFLNTGDSEGAVRGNMGLKDVRAALRWIQRNIAKFGGNRQRVTLFGESAGGVLVHYHVLSHNSAGLFHKAISQSGTAVNSWSLNSNPVAQARWYADKLGCPLYPVQEMVACMKNLPPLALMEANRDILNPMREPITVFRPTLEVKNDNDAVITENPLALLRNGLKPQVPWVAGVNSMEGLLLTSHYQAKNLLDQFDKNWETNIGNALWFDTSNTQDHDNLKRLREFYLGGGKASDTNSYLNFTHLFTDGTFSHGTQVAATLQSKHSPVYLYYYSYEGSFSLTDLIKFRKGKLPVLIEYIVYFGSRWIQQHIFGLPSKHLGPCHFDDVALLFPMTLFRAKINRKDKDYAMSRDLIKLWVQFGRDDSSMRFRNKPWPMLDSTQRPLKYFEINSHQYGLRDNPFPERMKFWDEFNYMMS